MLDFLLDQTQNVKAQKYWIPYGKTVTKTNAVLKGTSTNYILKNPSQKQKQI